MNDDQAMSQLSALPFRPGDLKSKDFPIALIGCGGITEHHLKAYKTAGYNVVALCDVNRDLAESRRIEFFPDAEVFDDYQQLLKHDDILVVDIATHTDVRGPIIAAALEAKKHVLSQKPFVFDLDEGQRLIDLADRMNVRLAVNQNGRWAPHFSFARNAVEAGLIGDLLSANLSVHWDHTWTKGTKFESIHYLILYDYAIHWFDIVSLFFGQVSATKVFATTRQTKNQDMNPPLLAQANIEYDQGSAALFFNACNHFGSENRMYLSGSEGSILSTGPNERTQTLTVNRESGSFTPRLEGSWFPDGFHGTMAELLCSIEENRTPTIDAQRNLKSLELCFAAIASTESGQPVVPGSVRKLPGT